MEQVEEDMENDTPTEPRELLIPDLVTPDLMAHHIVGQNTCHLPPNLMENSARQKELGNRNLLPIPPMAATRYDQYAKANVVISLAFLLDLINGGIVPSQYSYLVLDSLRQKKQGPEGKE